METWKDIKGVYVGYKVSSLGRVKSTSRYVKRNSGVMFLKEKIMKQTLREDGYLVVNLSSDKGDKSHRVHRLVAYAFIKNEGNKRTVNHKNGVKSDNRVENLEWATHSENHIHAYRELGRANAQLGKKGKDSLTSKKIAQFDKNGTLISTFCSAVEAQEKTGIGRGHICSVCLGSRKTTGGYVWKHI